MIHWFAVFALIACGFSFPAYLFGVSAEVLAKHLERKR